MSADEVIRRAETLRGARGNWEAHWQEVAEIVIPSYSNKFNNRGIVTGGLKRTEKQFDSTASIALGRFSAVMDSYITPANAQYQRLRATDDSLMKKRSVALWFDKLSRDVFRYRYAPGANFQSQMSECWTGLGAFGTACLLIDDMATKYGGTRYKSVHLGEVFFCDNHQGVIDTAYRIFMMTVRQMIQKWGEDVPKEIRDRAEKAPDTEFEIIHCVTPRIDYDEKRIDAGGAPWKSEYVSVTGKKTLSEGGYFSFPYGISRYSTSPGELYGRSPAMMALASIKTLNEQKKTVLKQGQRIVDPVLLAFDDGVLDSFSLQPGKINFGGVSADGRALIQPLPTGNIAIAKEMMEQERLIINDAFLVTLFQILVQTPEMTATEVLERTREKGALIAPTMGRQQTEMLGPMIEREIDLLTRQGKLDPMPPELVEAQGEYKVVYDSPFSRMQRSESASGALRVMQWAGEIAANTQNPAAMDWFNIDAMLPELADIHGMPVSWVNDMPSVQKIREGRQQQQATQQLIQAGPTIAAMAKSGVGAPA